MLLLRSEDTPLLRTEPRSRCATSCSTSSTRTTARRAPTSPMLLRRLGTALGVATDEQPLGAITPVATSATLGSGEGAGERLRAFARTVFGCAFDVGVARRRGPPHRRRSGSLPPGPMGDSVAIPLLDRHHHHRRPARSPRGTGPARGAEAVPRSRHRSTRSVSGRRCSPPPHPRASASSPPDPAPAGRDRTGVEPSWEPRLRRPPSPARHAVSLYLALLSRGTARRRPAAAGASTSSSGSARSAGCCGGSSSAPRFRWHEGAAGRGGRTGAAVGLLPALRPLRMGRRRHGRRGGTTRPRRVGLGASRSATPPAGGRGSSRPVRPRRGRPTCMGRSGHRGPRSTRPTGKHGTGSGAR